MGLTSNGSGGASGTVDSFARVSIAALTGQDNETIAAGRQVFVDGVWWEAPVGGATVAASAVSANMIADGFTQLGTPSTTETPSSYAIPDATADTDAARTAAYEAAQTDADKRVIGDWITNANGSWQRLDGEGDGAIWRKDAGEAESKDARTYRITGTNAGRDTAPTITEVTGVATGTIAAGSDVIRTLPNGIVQTWHAATENTLTLSSEDQPDEPIATFPVAPFDGYKVGDEFKFDNAGTRELWAFVDVAGTTQLVKQPHDGASSGGTSPTLSTDYPGILEDPAAGKINPNLLVTNLAPAANDAIDWDTQSGQIFNITSNGNNTLNTPANLPVVGKARVVSFIVDKTAATDTLSLSAYFAGTVDLGTNAALLPIAVTLMIMNGRGLVMGVKEVA